MGRIIDCFLFFNELDLLEIRLNALAPYVDRFVLCERAVTHSGQPKPLFFQENKERFKDFPIVHLIQPPAENMVSIPGTRDGRAWKLEHRQRDYLTNGFMDAKPDDWIMLSDLDEIPDMTKWDGKSEGAFKQKMYYYYLNCYTGVNNWKGTILQKRGSITADMNDVRNHRNHYPTIVVGGWHFSTLGPADNIVYKIQSFAHCELNKPEFVDHIAEKLQTLKDPYNRGADNWRQHPQEMKIEMPDGPQYLLDNRDKYKHLLYAD